MSWMTVLRQPPGCPHFPPPHNQATLPLADPESRIGDYTPRHCIPAYAIQIHMYYPQTTGRGLRDYRADFNRDDWNVFLVNHQSDHDRARIDSEISENIDWYNQCCNYDHANVVKFERLINKIRIEQHRACVAWFIHTRYGARRMIAPYTMRWFHYLPPLARLPSVEDDDDESMSDEEESGEDEDGSEEDMEEDGEEDSRAESGEEIEIEDRSEDEDSDSDISMSEATRDVGTEVEDSDPEE